jgi:hypothetical protein
MNKTWKRGAIVLATTLVVAGVGGAGTSMSAAGAPAMHSRTFVAKQIKGHAPGPRTFLSTEVERSHGKVIGYDSVTGRFKVRTATIEIAVAWPGGTLDVVGSAGQRTPFAGKIVGGTGKFETARGTVTTKDLGHNRTLVHVTYHL